MIPYQSKRFNYDDQDQDDDDDDGDYYSKKKFYYFLHNPQQQQQENHHQHRYWSSSTQPIVDHHINDRMDCKFVLFLSYVGAFFKKKFSISNCRW